jgi:hypothetical protein
MAEMAGIGPSYICKKKRGDEEELGKDYYLFHICL